MMTAADMQKIVVLRIPENEGNFRYWLAELSAEDARKWEERFPKLSDVNVGSELGIAFGDSLTLPQVMERLQRRDFQVFDFPRA
jgi:hypothetical protein